MRYRGLAAFPLLYAAAFVAVASWLSGGDAFGPFVSWQRLLVRALALAGCLAAISAFERGDYLRRAWLALAGGTVAILLRDVLRMFGPAQGSSPTADVAVVALFLLSNFGLLAGIWMLARSWKRAAVALPGGRSGAATVTVIAVLLAFAVAGPGALAGARQLAAGDSSALVLAVSSAVDIVTLCLIAPLLLTAISLRGGLFTWPWVLITASQASWLLYDGASMFGAELAPGFPLTDLFRGLAQNYLFAAGMAQLLVVRHVRRTVQLHKDETLASLSEHRAAS
jgi:hypothetical protein